MSQARYFRRTFGPILWGIGIAIAIAAALVFAHLASLQFVERTTTARVTSDIERESDSTLRVVRDSLDLFARRADSLQAIARGRDTVWLRARAAARQEVTAPVPLSTDTAALAATVRSCRATLDATVSACDSAQAAHRAVLATQQTQLAAAEGAVAAAAKRAAAIERSRDAAIAQLTRRDRRRSIERSVCAASIATNLVQWRLAR